MKKNINLDTLLKDNVSDTLERTGQLNEDITKELDIVNTKLVHLIGNVQAGVFNDTIPQIKHIEVGEHLINQSLTADAQTIFASLYGQKEVITKEELKTISIEFGKYIYPVITQCTKDIYNLIK